MERRKVNITTFFNKIDNRVYVTFVSIVKENHRHEDQELDSELTNATVQVIQRALPEFDR